MDTARQDLHEVNTGGNQHIATKWMRPAQEFGNLENVESRTHKQKSTFFKIRICVAQNVGKVQISRKKQFPTPFETISGKFVHGPEQKSKNVVVVAAVFLGGPMAPIHPVCGNGCNISAAIRSFWGVSPGRQSLAMSVYQCSFRAVVQSEYV